MRYVLCKTQLVKMIERQHELVGSDGDEIALKVLAAVDASGVKGEEPIIADKDDYSYELCSFLLELSKQGVGMEVEKTFMNYLARPSQPELSDVYVELNRLNKRRDILRASLCKAQEKLDNIQSLLDDVL